MYVVLCVLLMALAGALFTYFPAVALIPAGIAGLILLKQKNAIDHFFAGCFALSVIGVAVEIARLLLF